METISIPGFSEPFSSLSHLLGAGFFLVGWFILMRKARGNRSRVIALTLYSASLVFLFSMSGVYHLLEPELKPRYVLRHLDYAGIWILIAGSFIPLHILLFRGVKRWGILAPVWVTAITGISLQMVFFDTIPEWLSLSFFLFLGWIGLASMILIKKTHSSLSFKYLALGGFLYSFGAVLEFTRWPTLWSGVIGPHEVFHSFVVWGALSHWWYIYQQSNNPISKHLSIEITHFIEKKEYQGKGLNENILVSGKSIEEIDNKVEKWIDDNYMPSLRPDSVKFINSSVRHY